MFFGETVGVIWTRGRTRKMKKRRGIHWTEWGVTRRHIFREREKGTHVGIKALREKRRKILDKQRVGDGGSTKRDLPLTGG